MITKKTRRTKVKHQVILKIMLFFLLLCFAHESWSQPLLETGSLFDEVSDIISNMPGDTGDDYSDPTVDDILTWEHTVEALLDQNYMAAADSAALLQYDLVEFTDDTEGVDRIYYMLRANGTNYWGTYIHYPNYCIPVVIQSPHPKKDFNTGKQGVYVFQNAEAAFFALSGTSRCNHSNFSSCSGTTSVCAGSSESYRISDLAHVVSSAYQKTVEVLLTEWPFSYFLQLHGFTKLTSDPFIILSNGTQVTPSPDYIADFEIFLEAEDPLFVDSIKVAHQDLDWTRLRGFTNVQGRLINNSADHCMTSAATTNGRFIHMEQERTTLRDTEAGWIKVKNAIENTFSCAPLPIADLNWEVELIGTERVQCKIRFDESISSGILQIQRKLANESWSNIYRKELDIHSNLEISYLDIGPWNKNRLYYRFILENELGIGHISQIKEINLSQSGNFKIWPNPSKYELNISGEFDQGTEIELTNLVRQTAYSWPVSGSNHSIQINLPQHLNPGIYLIRYQNKSFKLIIN